jgi:hypothetical protein
MKHRSTDRKRGVSPNKGNATDYVCTPTFCLDSRLAFDYHHTFGGKNKTAFISIEIVKGKLEAAAYHEQFETLEFLKIRKNEAKIL